MQNFPVGQSEFVEHSSMMHLPKAQTWPSLQSVFPLQSPYIMYCLCGKRKAQMRAGIMIMGTKNRINKGR